MTRAEVRHYHTCHILLYLHGWMDVDILIPRSHVPPVQVYHPIMYPSECLIPDLFMTPTQEVQRFQDCFVCDRVWTLYKHGGVRGPFPEPIYSRASVLHHSPKDGQSSLGQVVVQMNDYHYRFIVWDFVQPAPD